MDIAWLKSRCILLGISRIHIENGRLVFTFEELNGLKPQVLAQATAAYGMRMTIYGGVKPPIRLTTKKKRLQEALEFTEVLLNAGQQAEEAAQTVKE